MQATLNDYDFEAIYGAVINDGMDSFFNYGDAKETLEHSFPEVDGIDKDLTSPKIAAREFVITITVTGQGRADFKTKYWGLRTELLSGGLHELYFTDHDETYHVYYKKQQNIKKLTTSMNGDEVALQFDIVFAETNPGDNIEDVYIVTEGDEYLIA